MSSSLTPKRLMVISLTILLLQNAAQSVLLRFLRTRKVDNLFYSSTAVCVTELFKFIICSVGLFVVQSKFSVRHLVTSLYVDCIVEWRESVRSTMLAFLYILQNNLHYVAASHLEVAAMQIAYQFKLFTTAIFSYLILGRSLNRLQYISLVVLCTGICLVQLQPCKFCDQYFYCDAMNKMLSPLEIYSFAEDVSTKDISSPIKSGQARLPLTSAENLRNARYENEYPVIGLIAVLISCLISGFAAVYFESMLKSHRAQCVLTRNIQLSTAGLLFSVAACAFYDGQRIAETSFLYGYDLLVWTLVTLIAAGGLCVAYAIKYADSIVKGYATSGAIVLATIASFVIFDFQPTPAFCCGSLLVLLAAYAYARGC